MNFSYDDDSEHWFKEILNEHNEEARSRALSLVADGNQTDEGCIETPTKGPRMVRFHGRQLSAYRFIFCILNGYPAGYDDVVRHRCDNRLCINPDHIEIGTRGENLMDEREFRANGVDRGLL